MTKQNSIAAPSPPLIAAPDKATLGILDQAIRDVGIRESVHIRISKGWKEAASLSEKTGAGRLLLVSDAEASIDLLHAVRRITDAGGWVGVWSAPAVAAPFLQPADAWMTEQLLIQQGAAVTPHLCVLAVAARLQPFTAKAKTRKIAVRGKPNLVAERLKAALFAEGFELVSEKKAVSFFVGDAGDILLVDGRDDSHSLGDPAMVSSAMKLVSRNLFAEPIEELVLQIRQDDVDLIAQPPPRVLSEIASKKLLVAFGMTVPFEQLCQSPSEAARVVAARPGLSVLKLVKPRLENKQSSGAVILGINGAAAARRAAQMLESLGASLGPPPFLGVLAADQVDGGLRVFVTMRVHPKFGRILLIGKGDRSDAPPLLALKAPASCSESLSSLLHAGIAPDGPAVRKIAEAVSRLSFMVSTLEGRINRAEIHPLVAVDTHSDALVLDALAAIGPD